MLRALAIVCVRNERIHIRRCLTDLIQSGLDVIVLDNDSDDGTREIATEFLGAGLLAIHRLPWAGAFSLSEQLRAKQEVAAQATHDWIVHADADEWLCSSERGQTLLEGIEEADAAGATCINFHELVFVPLPGEDFFSEDYARKMRTYYFFQPRYPRLNRAWRRDSGLRYSASGGHNLAGENLALFNRDFFLRHYIMLSEAHGRKKYLGRRFSEEDIGRHWHRNRRSIGDQDLVVRPNPGLRHLSDPSSNAFELDMPLAKHFWQWT